MKRDLEDRLLQSVECNKSSLEQSPRVVVMLSGGAGSYGAARRYIDRHGPEGVVGLFTNVKPPEDSEHLGEDKDTLRFVVDAAADLGIPLITLVAEENIYDVFARRKWLGNAQRAHCSWELKTKPAREWCDLNAPDATVIVGIDWSEESKRAAGIVSNWAPYPVLMPLCDKPLIVKPMVIDAMIVRGLVPPEMYALGFAHANCRGCVKAGQAHWKRVYEVWPETYLFHEQREREHREKFDQDVSILRDRSAEVIAGRLGLDMADLTRADKWWKVTANGQKLPRSLPLTLEMFRLRIVRGGQIDLFEEGGCGCFGTREAA